MVIWAFSSLWLPVIQVTTSAYISLSLSLLPLSLFTFSPSLFVSLFFYLSSRFHSLTLFHPPPLIFPPFFCSSERKIKLRCIRVVDQRHLLHDWIDCIKKKFSYGKRLKWRKCIDNNFWARSYTTFRNNLIKIMLKYNQY